MSLNFGTRPINAVHATFNSIWIFYCMLIEGVDTQGSWQSRNSSLLVTSSHVVITTTLPVRISFQTKRSKIINEIELGGGILPNTTIRSAVSTRTGKSNYTCVYVKYRTFLPSQPAWSSFMTLTSQAAM